MPQKEVGQSALTFCDEVLGWMYRNGHQSVPLEVMERLRATVAKHGHVIIEPENISNFDAN